MLTVIPTIDVEGVHGACPLEQMILGHIGLSDDWGVYRQARLFKQYGVSGTFFIDCYEHTYWGEKPFEQICSNLLDMEQDVQLHTHPSWRDDPRDSPTIRELKHTSSFLPQSLDLMVKLPLHQQIEVIEHGIHLISKWTGKKPIAHRSGGYSVNGNTIAALKEVGIPIDASMYRGHRNTHLTWSYNKIIDKDGVIEVPVTCYQISSFRSAKRLNEHHFCKTDIDDSSLRELISFVNDAKKYDIAVMTLFLHSYSLLRRDKSFNSFAPDRNKFKKLESFLQAMSRDRDVRFMSMSQFYGQYLQSPEDFMGSDFVPTITAPFKLMRRACGTLMQSIKRPLQPSH